MMTPSVRIRRRSLRHGRASTAFLLVLLATVAASGPAVGSEEADPPNASATYEVPPFELPIGEAVPAELLQDRSFRIRAPVENDGYMNHYTIESDLGTFTAASQAELRVRLHEIEALERLDEVTRTDAFVEALGRAALSPVGSAVQVVTRPVETIERLPGGVAAYFAETVREARKLAGQVRKVHRALGPEGDGREADPGGEEGQTATSTPEGWAAKGIDRAVEYAREKSGYERERRLWARRLGVTPYSDNETLGSALDRVAKASAMGGFSLRYLGLPDVEELDYVEVVHELAWELGSVELRDRNREILREELGIQETDPEAGAPASGLPESTLERLFDSPYARPDLVTRLTEAVVRLDGVGGREELVRLTAAAGSSVVASFLVRTAELFARHHQRVEPLDRLLPGPAVPVGRTTNGGIVAALAVDRVAWTEAFADLATSRTEGLLEGSPETSLDLYLSGAVSPTARRELERLGWTVHTEAFDRPSDPLDRTD